MSAPQEPEAYLDPPRKTLAGRLVALAQRRRSRSPLVEKALLFVALVLFGVGLMLALVNLPPLRLDHRWPLFLGGAVVTAVATIAVNGLEFTASARLLGSPVSAAVAFRTTVMAAAANVLPLPGGALVRARALRQEGHAYRKALSTTLSIGVIWVGIASVLAGLFLVVRGPARLGLVLGVGGVVLLGVAYVILRSQVGGAALRALVRFTLIEVLSVSTTSVRLLFLLLAIDVHPTWSQAFALALSGIVASATGLFPGGLGLREVLSGAMAGAVGLAVALGVLVAALDRVLNMAVLGLASAVLQARGSDATLKR